MACHLGKWLRNEVMEENKVKPSFSGLSSYRIMFNDVLTSNEVVGKSKQGTICGKVTAYLNRS